MNVLGIGSEIVECLRIARMIERHGELFLNRVFSSHEIRFCQSRKHSTQYFASHWAAKEAIFRVLDIRRGPAARWLDIEIREEGGTILVGWRGGVRDAVVARGVHKVMVSMAHCRSYATAYVLAFGPPTTSSEKD